MVVTGLGRGIGRTIALRFAEAGGKVALLARTGADVHETAALIEKSGGCARPFVMDVTDAPVVRTDLWRCPKNDTVSTTLHTAVSPHSISIGPASAAITGGFLLTA
jgi:NAD(P)-dependent dehydrogenase (short-subunit alcohol dehydrogenase family)